MNAICETCNKEMVVNAGCTGDRLVVTHGSSSYAIARIPHDQLVPCHDCNVGFDQFHHPGCDMERCPTCGGQLISCNCHSKWYATSIT